MFTRQGILNMTEALVLSGMNLDLDYEPMRTDALFIASVSGQKRKGTTSIT